MPAGRSTERVLRVAASLFRKKGYAATTTRELAAHLGMQSASLYYYLAGGKEDLLYALCVDSLTRIRAVAVEAIAKESDAEARLRALCRVHITTAMADEDKHASMLLELKSLSSRRRAEVVALRDAYEKIVRGVITAGQAEGVIRDDIDAKVLGLALLNLLNWSIFWFRSRGPVSAPALGDILAEVFLRGTLRHHDRNGSGRVGSRTLRRVSEQG